MKMFNITIEGECMLRVDEIWPDGNAPEKPTAKDVIFDDLPWWATQEQK